MKCCDHCGQRIRKLNPHRMDAKKVRMLSLIGELGSDAPDGWVEIKAGRFHGFGGDDQVYTMRLVWFGLVEHGPRRSALYRITQDGINFLRGTHAVPAVIWCRDGTVEERDELLVTVGSVKDVVLDRAYWDSYASQQKYAEAA